MKSFVTNATTTQREAPDGLELAAPLETMGKTGSLSRAARILRAVAAGGQKGVSAADIVRATGLPRPTVYRVMQMLEELGWLERAEGSRRVFLGSDLALLGLSASHRHSLDLVAGDILDSLSLEIGQTIYLSVRSGDDAVCVARVESGAQIRTLVLEVGSRHPLGLGAGSMALLAAQSDNEIAAIVARNMPRFRTRPSFDEAAFNRALALAREGRHASHQGLFTHGVSGIGVAVRDDSGHPAAAISAAFITVWLDTAQLEQCTLKMEQAAQAVASRLAVAAPRD
ncbi:MAG: IclR family transcriptional regulator [Rhizobiaceae bacterium]|nr:IclR family transcriptional regulator [Rhizobiaceae bacterium]